MYGLKLFLQSILLPPMNFFVLAVIGFAFRRYRAGRIAIGVAALLFVISSIPALGFWILSEMRQEAPISQSDLSAAQAIVLLPAGVYPNAREYDGQDVASNSTLVRARYAGWLHRKYGLPILIVGERVVPSRRTEAAVASALLTREFHIPVRWTVEIGRDTLESAKAAGEVLLPVGISRVALVTSPRHMPRAASAFENVGFTVFGAPTPLRPTRSLSLYDFIPSSKGFSLTGRAMNEGLGRLWTRVFASSGED